MIAVVALVAQIAMDRPVPLDSDLPFLAKEGRANLRQLQGKGNLVLFFLNEQCSVTFYYKARLQRLVADFEPKGFRFVAIRAGKKQVPNQAVRLPEAEYLKVPFLEDEKGELMARFGVGQSLTFAAIDRGGRLRYLGGIDDNVNPAKVKRSGLRNALSAMAAGRPVVPNRFETFGCAIVPMGKP